MRVGYRAIVNTSKRIPTFNHSPLFTRSFFTSPVTYGSGLGLRKHNYTELNNDSTPFEFSLENLKTVKEILARYPDNFQRGATIPLLHLAQKQVGWLPLAAMNKVAKIVGVEPSQVYETATFYSMFIREPIGKYVVGVCMTTPCMLCNSEAISDAIQNYLGIHYGGTTKDGLFTLLELECLGACANAPMISIGEHYYEDLTPETTIKVLKEFQAGRIPKPGPQNGLRKVAEPAGGKTTLFEEPQPPPFRTDGQL